jgi:hypothetical protein
MAARPKSGCRYRVTTGFETSILTHWRAPFTGSGKAFLPVGLELVVKVDAPETASAVLADTVTPEQWETVLVDEQDRTAEKYNGYTLVVSFECLKRHCARC